MTTERTVTAGYYVRSRGFGIGPYGRNKWWMARVRHDGFLHGAAAAIPVTGFGHEVIEVMEVVRTETFGEVAFVRHWIEDPDGAEVTLDWLPSSEDVAAVSVTKLGDRLASLKMERAERGQREVMAPAGGGVIVLSAERERRMLAEAGMIETDRQGGDAA